MRHGIVAAGAFVVALTLLGWFVGRPPHPSPEVVVAAAPAFVEPPTTVPPTTVPSNPVPSTTVPSTTVPPAPVPSTPVDAASMFLRALDDERAAHGLAPLTRRADLDEMARSWAVRLAAEGELRHSDLIHEIVAGDWTTAGENLGYGPSPARVFEALVDSPAHRANILDPDFHAVGIGVVWVDDVLWTAHLFAGHANRG